MAVPNTFVSVAIKDMPDLPELPPEYQWYHDTYGGGMTYALVLRKKMPPSTHYAHDSHYGVVRWDKANGKIICVYTFDSAIVTIGSGFSKEDAVQWMVTFAQLGQG